MFGMSLGEIALVLIIALLVVGPKNLPKAARSLGRAYGWARHHLAVMQREINREIRRLDMEEAEKKVGPIQVSERAPKAPTADEEAEGEEPPPLSQESLEEGYDSEQTEGQTVQQSKILHDLPPSVATPGQFKERNDPQEETET